MCFPKDVVELRERLKRKGYFGELMQAWVRMCEAENDLEGLVPLREYFESKGIGDVLTKQVLLDMMEAYGRMMKPQEAVSIFRIYTPLPHQEMSIYRGLEFHGSVSVRVLPLIPLLSRPFKSVFLFGTASASTASTAEDIRSVDGETRHM